MSNWIFSHVPLFWRRKDAILVNGNLNWASLIEFIQLLDESSASSGRSILDHDHPATAKNQYSVAYHFLPIHHLSDLWCCVRHIYIRARTLRHSHRMYTFQRRMYSHSHTQMCDVAQRSAARLWTIKNGSRWPSLWRCVRVYALRLQFNQCVRSEDM